MSFVQIAEWTPKDARPSRIQVIDDFRRTEVKWRFELAGEHSSLKRRELRHEREGNALVYCVSEISDRKTRFTNAV